jgi:hypothetical protein
MCHKSSVSPDHSKKKNNSMKLKGVEMSLHALGSGETAAR